MGRAGPHRPARDAKHSEIHRTVVDIRVAPAPWRSPVRDGHGPSVEHGSWWSSRTVTSSRCPFGTSSASTWSTRGTGPVLSGCSGPHSLGPASKHSERALGRPRAPRSSTPLGADHAQSLRRLALPEGRSVRCLFATPSRWHLSSWGHFSRRNSCAGIFSAHHPRSRRCNPAGLFGVR